jgi:GH15 family glucan-1,4-alpha-glucosidase
VPARISSASSGPFDFAQGKLSARSTLHRSAIGVIKQQMAKIEDYAFLSDTQTGALVSREGSVDWLCFPRFDSGACFAALLGDRKNG